jgi:hypothetical protein
MRNTLATAKARRVFDYWSMAVGSQYDEIVKLFRSVTLLQRSLRAFKRARKGCVSSRRPKTTRK